MGLGLKGPFYRVLNLNDRVRYVILWSIYHNNRSSEHSSTYHELQYKQYSMQSNYKYTALSSGHEYWVRALNGALWTTDAVKLRFASI